MWGRWEASSANPFEKTLRRRSLVATACWSIVASGSRRMSIAVTAFGSALAAAGSVVWAVARPVPRASMATEQASAPFSWKRVRFLVFGFMVVFFSGCSVFGQWVVDDFSKAKICFQSSFMLTTFQPFVAAAFNDALSGSA